MQPPDECPIVTMTPAERQAWQRHRRATLVCGVPPLRLSDFLQLHRECEAAEWAQPAPEKEEEVTAMGPSPDERRQQEAEALRQVEQENLQRSIVQCVLLGVGGVGAVAALWAMGACGKDWLCGLVALAALLLGVMGWKRLRRR